MKSLISSVPGKSMIIIFSSKMFRDTHRLARHETGLNVCAAEVYLYHCCWISELPATRMKYPTLTI